MYYSLLCFPIFLRDCTNYAFVCYMAFLCHCFHLFGPGSSVGIVTGYGLDGPGDRIPVEARFYAPVRTGPGAHPASCTMGTGSFPGVNSGRGVTLTPHPLLVPLVMKEYSYTSTPPFGLYGLYRASVPVQGWPLPFHSFDLILLHLRCCFNC
jgi:hypothetical protein